LQFFLDVANILLCPSAIADSFDQAEVLESIKKEEKIGYEIGRRAR
jgi:hypothetical protein